MIAEFRLEFGFSFFVEKREWTQNAFQIFYLNYYFYNNK